MSLSESTSGPFKPFALLSFPMSWPAVAFGTLAVAIYRLGQAALAGLSSDLDSQAEAHQLFLYNLGSLFGGFRIGSFGGSHWLFAAQMLLVFLLWGVLGTAICRILGARLGREDYVGYRDALSFGFRRAASVWLYPVILLGAAAIPLLFNALLGALMQIPGLGIVFYLLLPLAWLATILLFFLALSGLFGFGLVPGAIAVENKGTMDAWGKSLNYLFARPLHVLLYLVLLKVFLFDILVRYVFEGRILERWTESTLGLFYSGENLAAVTARDSGSDADAMTSLSRVLYHGVLQAFDLLASGFAVSCFFAAFVGMFLVFRRDVDGIDVSDIELEERDPEFEPRRVASD